MAAKPGSVWSIDVGTNSIKALRLQVVEDRVEVIDFDNIEHSKLLAGPEISTEKRNEQVAQTLREFVGRHGLSKDQIVISIPGQSSFARFIKLPPVESKRIPEIIRFEAIQQIPFDINEVEWDWQLMEKPDSPNVEVGIFAIKNELLNAALEPFNRANIRVSCVQMSPMALYNYILFDRRELGETSTSSVESAENKAVIVLDMGAENTDLVICTKTSVWQRCIPLGGNAFTRAVAETFKLDFEKAEKLKRTAPMSKYARQIFQAMKPVFTDFGAEIQRSLGFYRSARRQANFSKVVILGGGMKLQGIGKFLQQSLQVPVVKPDSFEKLAVSSTVSAAKFHENVSDFGIVYGLALQGLGLGRIESNLLPRKVARSMLWARKARYITTAAMVFLVVCLACLARVVYDKGRYQGNENVRRRVTNIVNLAESASTKLREVKALDSKYEAVIKKELELFNFRNVIPLIHQTIISCLPNTENNPGQAGLYKAFSVGDIGSIKQIERNERKQIFVTSLSVGYAEDIEQARLSDFRGRTRGADRGGAPGMPGSPGVPGVPGGIPGVPGGMMIPGGAVRPGMPPGGAAVRRTTSRRRSQAAKAGAKKEDMEAKDKAGFIVTIEGYSPYENISELLDPVGVSNTQSRWGVVTRLMNLDKTFICEGCGKMLVGRDEAQVPKICPNCMDKPFKPIPIKLYERTNIQHFRLETGEVEVDSADMPAGIGIEEDETDLTRQSRQGDRMVAAGVPLLGGRGAAVKRGAAQRILIDPMTQEVISKVVERNENGNEKYDVFGKPLYIVNDHWFRIQAKLVWKSESDEKAQDKTEQESSSEQKRTTRRVRRIRR
jgi:type IV pilus assembly protein PilM